MLAADGIGAAVVSMPCWELFEQQPEDYRSAVLGTAPRVAVEAAVRLGWDRWLGERGAFVGMHGFGASAPGTRPTSISASRRKRSPRRRGCCSDPNAIRLGVVLTGARYESSRRGALTEVAQSGARA